MKIGVLFVILGLKKHTKNPIICHRGHVSNTVPNMTGSRQSYVQPDLGPGAETRKCCRLRDELSSIFFN